MTPIIENEIGDMIAKTVAEWLLSATADVRKAVMESTISLVCVGTPSQLNGNLHLSHVRKVCEEIGIAVKEKEGFHLSGAIHDAS